MSMLDDRTLSLWVNYFKGNRFSRYGIEYMKKLVDIEINPEFMLQMQRRWDTRTHTFRFGNHEMCPTIEEFKAILGIPDERQILHFKWLDSIKPVLKKEFGFTKHIMKRITKHHALDLMELSKEVMSGIYIPENERTQLLTIVIILAHYLLSPEDNKPSNYVLKVAIELTNRNKDPSAIILAETLMGLDKSMGKKEILKQGSPLLLQIWLLDKMGVLQPPPPSIKWMSPLMQMERLLKVQKIDLVKSFDDDDTPQMIRCTMPWYGIKKMAYSMEGIPIIFLLGLNETTFYIPGRIPQQFGLSLVPLMPTGAIIHVPKFTQSLHNNFPEKWKSIQRMSIIDHEDEDDEEDLMSEILNS
ncbi:uncharacterized protein LOC124940699 [Impatiens glandulifera]|uniref:uncharacterized protein LOC124940699 n=1 Tax=Impatiens glandulifera TaxID=253017 RepID=UPI001FB0A000|nr:uncharacterized protein LOC124940699 [Impatiens glandulifera]